MIMYVSRRAFLKDLHCSKILEGYFDMSQDYGGSGTIYDFIGPTFYKILKYKQPGTGYWPMIPFTIWHQTFVGKRTIWTNTG